MLHQSAQITKNNTDSDMILLKSNLLPLNLNATSLILYQFDLRIYAQDMLITDPSLVTPIFWAMVENRANIFTNPQDIVFDDMCNVWSRKNLLSDQEQMMFFMKHYNVIYRVVMKFSELIEIDPNPNKLTNRKLSAKILLLVATQKIRLSFDDYQVYYDSCDRGKMVISAAHFGSNVPNHFTEPEEASTVFRGLLLTAKYDLDLGFAIAIDVVANLVIKPKIALSHLLIESVFGSRSAFEDVETLYQNMRSIPNKKWAKSFDKMMKGMYVTAKDDVDGRLLIYRRMCLASPYDYFIETKRGIVSLSQHFDYKCLPLKYTDLPLVEVVTVDGCEYIYPLEMLFTPNSFQVCNTNLTGEFLEKVKVETSHATSTRFDILDGLVFGRKPNTSPVFDSSDKWMTNFGVNVGQNFVRINGSIIQSPCSTLRDNSNSESHAFSNKMDAPIKCAKLEKPTILVASVIVIQNPEEEPQECVKLDLRKIKNVLNVVKGQKHQVLQDANQVPMIVTFGTYHSNWRMEKLTAILHSFQRDVCELTTFNEAGKKVIPLIFFIMPKQFEISSKSLGTISYVCHSEVGVDFQLVSHAEYDEMKISSNDCPIAQKLAAKVISKMRIYPSNSYDINDAFWRKLTDAVSPTLVLGVSSSHPTDLDVFESGVGSLTYATVVANINTGITKFAENVTPQKMNSISISGFRSIVRFMMEKFMDNSEVWPKHIVVYRADVGCSDHGRVMEKEIAAIRSACSKFSPEYAPTITYFFVTPKHDLYAIPLNAVATKVDRKAAIYINNGVVARGVSNFYLDTGLDEHNNKPTHYILAYDEWKCSNEFWKRICHFLCLSSTSESGSYNYPYVIHHGKEAIFHAKSRLIGYEQLLRQKYELIDGKIIGNPEVLQLKLHPLLDHHFC